MDQARTLCILFLPSAISNREIKSDQRTIRPVKQPSWGSIVLHHVIPFPLVLRLPLCDELNSTPAEVQPHFLIIVQQPPYLGPAPVKLGLVTDPIRFERSMLDLYANG